MPEAVINTWMEIRQNKTFNRAYKKLTLPYMGEEYYDDDKAEIKTFISVNE